MAGFLKNSGIWPFGKSGPRRREVRRAHNGQGLGLRLLRQDVAVPVLLLGLFLATICLVLFYGQANLPYRVGQHVIQPIVARVDFGFEDPLVASREQDKARSATPDFYRLDNTLIGRANTDLDNLTKALQESQSLEDFTTKAPGWGLDAESWQYLQRLIVDRPDRWQQIRDDLGRRLARAPIIQGREAAKREPKSVLTDIVCIRSDNREEHSFPIDLAEPEGLNRAVDQIVYASAYSTEPLAMLPAGARTALRDYFRRLLGPTVGKSEMNPVYTYDAEMTQRRMEMAAKAISGMQLYSEGQTLVPRDGTITETVMDLLRAERAAYLAKREHDPVQSRQYLLHRLGICGVAMVVVLGLAVYTLHYRPQVFASITETVELMLLILLAVIACRWLAISSIQFADRWAIIPIWLVGSIVALATQQRYAIGVVFAAAVLAVLALHINQPNAMSTHVMLVSTTLVAVGLLGDIRTRTRLVTVGLVASAAAFFLSYLADLAMMQPQYALRSATCAAAAALVASLLLQFMLPFLERFFGVVTGMTLLEWCDINKPLLRRLAREAPGTYNHALVLGSMAEAAAESIGAHGLLTRVGAYYHDIGKINKPRYFVENQQAGANWHDRLSPTMSLLIIIGHVKDGLELAREYGLPKALWSFIGEHHGTTLVRYFYRQAADRQTNGGQQVTESDFRYPGPKPRSRETAILMLCDSVESAVRTLSEPTPGRIEGLVHQMVMDRLADGQFEECDITLRELHRVEESVVKSLCAIYHGRIAYPSAREAAKESPRPKQAQTA